jgi:UDPglucose--hexose-1-phosphate uridylyltransferase
MSSQSQPGPEIRTRDAESASEITKHISWNPVERNWHLRVPWRASLASAAEASGPCPFCPDGAEAVPDATPRLIPSKYPFISAPAKSSVEAHRVLLFSPQHELNIDALDVSHLAAILRLIGEETALLLEHPDVEAVYTFQAFGSLFGGSVAHPHLQLLGLPFIPAKIVPDLTNGCPLCGVVGVDQLVVAQTDNVVLAVPPWSRLPYELVVTPRAHVASLTDCDTAEVALLLSCALKASKRLANGQPTPYILSVMSAPKSVGGLLEVDHHLRVELLPFTSDTGSLRGVIAIEAALGVILNPLLPHHAADRMRQLVETETTGNS